MKKLHTLGALAISGLIGTACNLPKALEESVRYYQEDCSMILDGSSSESSKIMECIDREITRVMHTIPRECDFSMLFIPSNLTREDHVQSFMLQGNQSPNCRRFHGKLKGLLNRREGILSSTPHLPSSAFPDTRYLAHDHNPVGAGGSVGGAYTLHTQHQVQTPLTAQ